MISKELLCENLRLLEKSILWLLKSYDKAKVIQHIDEENIEIFETLSNRFGRTVDILINKVLRSLDIYELEYTGTKLDVVIRAEKRGFVENYKTLIELKDLRNELVHEYIEEEIYEKFREIVQKTPLLVDISKKVIKYTSKYCKGETDEKG